MFNVQCSWKKHEFVHSFILCCRSQFTSIRLFDEPLFFPVSCLWCMHAAYVCAWLGLTPTYTHRRVSMHAWAWVCVCTACVRCRVCSSASCPTLKASFAFIAFHVGAGRGMWRATRKKILPLHAIHFQWFCETAIDLVVYNCASLENYQLFCMQRWRHVCWASNSMDRYCHCHHTRAHISPAFVRLLHAYAERNRISISTKWMSIHSRFFDVPPSSSIISATRWMCDVAQSTFDGWRQQA